jgi:predicted RNA-binding protein YlxR (DUF448 family)
LLKPRKTPMRMCVGCREMKPKKELLRVVKSPAGPIAFDRVGKAPGRGAYVCPDPECLKKAQKSKALDRALEAQVSQEVYDTLLTQLGADA